MKHIGKAIAILSIATGAIGLSPAIYAETIPNIIAQSREEILTKQKEAPGYLGAMNLAQLAYYLEHSTLTTRIENLGIDVPLETNNYRYSIIDRGDEIRQIIMTAKAKDSRLKSYTSAVFIFSLGETRTAIAGICETIKPSTFPPMMPSLPQYPSMGVSCPDDSHALIEFDRQETL